MSLAELTAADFEPYVGQTFAIAPPGAEPFDAVLASCTESSHEVPDEWKERIGRKPFSLLFVVEGAEHAFQQQAFAVRHPDAGDFEIFLVPLGPGPGGSGMRYEAVFS